MWLASVMATERPAVDGQGRPDDGVSLASLGVGRANHRVDLANHGVGRAIRGVVRAMEWGLVGRPARGAVEPCGRAGPGMSMG